MDGSHKCLVAKEVITALMDTTLRGSISCSCQDWPQGLAGTTGPGDGKGIGGQKGREKCWDIDIICMIF